MRTKQYRRQYRFPIFLDSSHHLPLSVPDPTASPSTSTRARKRLKPALAVKNLRKSFGKFDALRGVSFQLRRGERLALLGPNGAGKTTLIRILAGRTRPSDGSVSLFGHPIDGPNVRESLGLVPQDLALYSDLTARENLMAFGRFHGLPRRELRIRVDWALEWTGLRDRASKLVGGFSGGMKRRVNLACGVLHNPKLILLDEPTVGVDPQSRQRIFAMLDELNQAGTSILLTTHHLDEAEERSDRIVIFDEGQVIANGTFDDLVSSTVGPSRLARIKLSEPIRKPIPLWGEQEPPVGCVGETFFETRIDDITLQVAPLIDAVQSYGYGVTDLEINAPSLHHVFLHLTGHELRD